MAYDLTPAQIRAARAMLDWSLLDLARSTSVSVATAKRAMDGHPVPSDALAAIRQALESQGVRFLPDDGTGPGVRLR